LGVLAETHIRLEAILHVRALRDRWAAVPASELAQFALDGQRIHLKGQQGIFKPRELTEPVSVTSTLDSAYTRDVLQGSRVLYDYVAREHENEGLKRCGEAQLPLIYFLQVGRKPSPEYAVFAPVYVCGWDDAKRCFLIDLSEQQPGQAPPPTLMRQLDLPAIRTPDSPMEVRELERRYLVSAVEERLQHVRFRSAVLEAYRDRCAVCELHIRPLLDAARLVNDGEPESALDVRQGLALCATHHRAFDAGLIRFNPEYVIEVDLADAPVGEGERSMLIAFAGKRLLLPRDQSLWPVGLTT
jgi:putative restriction endonuclease